MCMLAGSARAAINQKPIQSTNLVHKHSKRVCEGSAVVTQGERGVNAAILATVRHRGSCKHQSLHKAETRCNVVHIGQRLAPEHQHCSQQWLRPDHRHAVASHLQSSMFCWHVLIRQVHDCAAFRCA